MRHSHAGSSAHSRALTASIFRALKCSWCPITEQHPQLALLKPLYWAPAVFLLSLWNQQLPVRVAKALRVGVGGAKALRVGVGGVKALRVGVGGVSLDGGTLKTALLLSFVSAWVTTTMTLCQKGQ